MFAASYPIHAFLPKPIICIANSEIGAGTRGSSLGPDAALLGLYLHVAPSLFNIPKIVRVPPAHQCLQAPPQTACKYLKEVANYCKKQSEKIRKIVTLNNIPFVLSGDHSTAAGTIGGILQAKPKERLGVIWIDAHPDLHTPYTSHSGHVHGMPLAASLCEDNTTSQQRQPAQSELIAWAQMKALGGGHALHPQDICFVGTRDIDGPEKSLMDASSMHVISVEQLRKAGVAATIRKALTLFDGCGRIFISFDVDSMNKTIAPGTGTPVPAGFTHQEVLDLNVGLVTQLSQQHRLAGWEMTELNPLLDKKGMTVQRVTHVFYNSLQACQTVYKKHEH